MTDPRLEIAARLVRGVLDPLKATFVGKDEIVDLLGVSLAAGENLFILGPPGTAKSALVQELARRLEGRSFEYLLTRFTEPNELFGPFDIRRLREGDLVTNTDGMLPEASLVFLDELLNANSAILNSLLTVLNERMFRRGRESRRLPLLMVVGASNHLPEDDALGALFDRFLLRVQSDNVATEHLGSVLDAGWKLDVASRADAERPAGVTMDDVRALHGLIAAVDLGPARPAYVELVGRLRDGGIAVSDRRAVKLQRLVAASALLCGRTTARVSDLWVVRHIWDTEEQQEVLAGIVDDVVSRGAGAAAADANDHPRARPAERPDPERLAADLDRLAAELEQTPESDAPGRARLRDQVSLLAGRCEWVGGEEQRGFLRERIERLWAALGTR